MFPLLNEIRALFCARTQKGAVRARPIDVGDGGRERASRTAGGERKSPSARVPIVAPKPKMIVALPVSQGWVLAARLQFGEYEPKKKRFGA